MKQSAPNPADKPVITIPKDNAVFRMDDQGRWHNRHGPFEHKKLVAYFNASIRMDEEGYYVTQDCGEFIEKVYFPYKVTALFAVDLKWQSPVELLLNTGLRLRLVPEDLYIFEDQLYMRHNGETIKFAQRVLMKLSERIDFEHGCYWVKLGGMRYALADR